MVLYLLCFYQSMYDSLINDALQVCLLVLVFFFFKQKTAYEMRISDWSSDVCSSDLTSLSRAGRLRAAVDASSSPRSWVAASAASPATKARRCANALRPDASVQATSARLQSGATARCAPRREAACTSEIGRASCR